MDQSVGCTIEKIKLHEQDMEAKLKEKREYEAALASLHRDIKDAISQTEKSDQEQLEITMRINKLRPLLEIERIKRDALSIQLKTLSTMLKELKTQSDRGITNVWNLRSSLCETVQNVSNECDLWALLIRPVCTDPLPLVITKNVINKENIPENDGRLQTALKRREKVQAEREKLLAEPEIGEEFIRIKNALRYSLEKIADLQNKSNNLSISLAPSL